MSIGIGTLLALAAVGYAGSKKLAHHDGPIGPLPGGPLERGKLVDAATYDWSALRNGQLVEHQTLVPLRSRTTGIMVHEGQPYMPCDLGFIWRRAPWPGRAVMGTVWLVKQWHRQVEADGRLFVRIGDERIAVQAVRETDPERLSVLMDQIETAAADFVGQKLSPRPSPPDPIWFFRLDPR